jgi:agmatinase
MKNHEGFSNFLHLYPPISFLDAQSDFENSRIVVLGAPLDNTGTNRQGYRFAPNSVRESSRSLEYFSPRSGHELNQSQIADIGNMELSMDISIALGQIEETTKEILTNGKRVLVLGGEHTISMGCVQACKPEILVVFDAHLDCRDSYKDLKVSHATWLRRSSEAQSKTVILHVGARAYVGEEKDYAKDRISTIGALDVLKGGNTPLREILRNNEGRSCWISFDMDVFDPAYAPAVGNPEPEGLSPTHVFDLIQELDGLAVLGFDIDEVVPDYDKGQTSLLASKLAIEMCSLARLAT